MPAPRPSHDRSAPPHPGRRDRKSTRLNSSHLVISYAVFCLKTKRHCDRPWCSRKHSWCAASAAQTPHRCSSPAGRGRAFFFNDTATTEIYTLSLHDALPISPPHPGRIAFDSVTLPDGATRQHATTVSAGTAETDRKSTRLNSSHLVISY